MHAVCTHHEYMMWLVAGGRRKAGVECDQQLPWPLALEDKPSCTTTVHHFVQQVCNVQLLSFT
jgi:hypothetical protein